MQLRIMTSNIWGDYFGNEVEVRDEQLFGIYQKYAPDVVGFQEMTHGWYLSPIWEKMAKVYTFAGTEWFSERNFTPLMYNTERFSMLESGWKYLPETPDTSKSITWVVLKDKESEKVFACCNTHFWWMLGPEHDELREKNAIVLIALLRDLEQKYNCPVFAFGDFNCGDGSSAFAQFPKNRVTDTFDVAKERRDVISWHGNPERGADGRFHGEADTKNRYHHEKSFDHIVGIGKFTVQKHEVVLDQDALDATDHSPVFADVIL